MPEIRLAIECDGTYWHSTDRVMKRDAHKDTLCLRQGIELIRVKQQNWLQARKTEEEKIVRAVSAVVL